MLLTAYTTALRPRQAVVFAILLVVTMGCFFSVALPGPSNTPLKTTLLELALFAFLPATFAVAFVPGLYRALRSAAIRRGGVLLHGVVVTSTPTGMMTNYVPEYRASIRLDDGGTSSATLSAYDGLPAGTDVMVKVSPRNRNDAVIDSVRFDGAADYTKL